MILPFSSFSPSHKYYKILWMAIVAFNVIFTKFEDVLEKKELILYFEANCFATSFVYIYISPFFRFESTENVG